MTFIPSLVLTKFAVEIYNNFLRIVKKLWMKRIDEDHSTVKSSTEYNECISSPYTMANIWEFHWNDIYKHHYTSHSSSHSLYKLQTIYRYEYMHFLLQNQRKQLIIIMYMYRRSIANVAMTQYLLLKNPVYFKPFISALFIKANCTSWWYHLFNKV